MSHKITTRFPNDLYEDITAYQKTYRLNRSDAIKQLVLLGLGHELLAETSQEKATKHIVHKLDLLIKTASKASFHTMEKSKANGPDFANKMDFIWSHFVEVNGIEE